MNKSEFESQIHHLLEITDKEVEILQDRRDSGESEWQYTRNAIIEERAVTLNRLREIVNNYLYGVESAYVYHPNDGVRVDENLVPYTGPKVYA